MEIMSLRAGICCHGKAQAAPFDKLAVATFGRKEKKLTDRYSKMAVHQGLVNWLGKKLIIFLPFSETFVYA